MLNLKVNIDQKSGFCFGVVYAIEMAEDILKEDGELYCLGDIVHNDEEVARLSAMGLKTIEHKDLPHLNGKKVLIRAHGEHPSTYRTAIENNIQLIDASCPVVLKLQHRVKRSFDQGDPIYIYGKDGHPEVRALLGQTKENAIVFQDLKELNIDKLPRKFTLYSQTTKSKEKFKEIKETLADAGIEVNINETICSQVSSRDKKLRKFAQEHDIIIFVSGKKSSNGKVLYNVCLEQNKDTHFISTKDELNFDWFSDNNTIGICGATSTPMWLMDEIKQEIEAI